MASKLIFLSDGEMMVLDGGRPRRLDSERKAQYARTVHDLQERNAWKYEGAGAKFQHQVNPYELRSGMLDAVCQIRAAVPWQGKLLYALTTPEMGGLYIKPLEEGDSAESHWLSERGFCPMDLHARGEQAVLALDTALGERHIALMKAGSARYEFVTQGDTQDSAPFLCEDGRTLYYVSAGWARSEDGRAIAKGPSELLRQDLHTGRLEEIAADDNYDYLRPRIAPDGTLYVIRRPYKMDAPRRVGIVDRVKSIGSVFKGLGRLLRFIGDPEGAAKRTPRTAGQTTEAAQQRMFEGMLLDITRSSSGTDEGEGCIPQDWVLLRQAPDGHFEEELRGAADYDFDGEALIYTDGRRIIRLEDGKKTVLHKAVFIPRLAVCK